MKYSNVFSVLALTAFAASANAGLVINSINVKMANTGYALSGASTYNDAKNAFSNGSEFCDMDLDALTGITARGTCGGNRRDFGALYSISGVNSGITDFQFGLDWGRGGFIVSQANSVTDIVKDSSDIWWSNKWTHSDVLDFTLMEQGSFTLTLLGFEGCCDGANSARYRNRGIESSGPVALINQSTFSDDPLPGAPMNSFQQLPIDDEWQALEVNAVPAPGSLALMGAGALLLLRRNRSRVAAS